MLTSSSAPVAHQPQYPPSPLPHNVHYWNCKNTYQSMLVTLCAWQLGHSHACVEAKTMVTWVKTHCLYLSLRQLMQRHYLQRTLSFLLPLTLQLSSLSSKMFLAAMSLWTKDLPARHTKPSTTCLQNWSRRLGRSGSDLRESLKRDRRRTSTKVLLVCSCTYDHQSKHRTSTPRTPT